MAKELVLMSKKKYEELTQNKQSDLQNDINQKKEATINFETPQCSDQNFPAQSGDGLIVRQQFSGYGVPGISNRVLQKSKKSIKKKKKTKIQWLKF